MSRERRRAVLEEIVYGADASATERLRALELLQHLDGREAHGGVFRRELEELDDQALDRLWDALFAEEIRELLDGGEAAERMPCTAERLRAEVEWRVEERWRRQADTAE